MKKLYFTILVMMVAALCLTSCGDDNDEITSSGDIVGTWLCTSADYGEWGDMIEENVIQGDVLYINKDHTYSVIGNGMDNGTWQLKGSKLTFKSEETITFTVSILNETTLSFQYSHEFGTFKYVFKRQK